MQKILRMKLMYLIALVFIFDACNNSNHNNGDKDKQHADSLMGEVIKVHNVGMAKMDRIDEGEKKVQQRLDSISRLPSDTQKSSAKYKMQLDSMLGRLKLANEAMENWMNAFNMDSSLNNMQQRIQYLESEKMKIGAVKDAMIRTLQKADSLLTAK